MRLRQLLMTVVLLLGAMLVLYGCSDLSNVSVGRLGEPSGVDTSQAATTSQGAGESTSLTGPVAPQPPSNLQLLNVAATSIQLRWVDNSTNEQGFHIKRKVNNGSWQLIATTPPNTTYYVDNGLTPQTQYCYLVTAFNQVGDSAATSIPCVTTPAPPPSPVNLGLYYLSLSYPDGVPMLGHKMGIDFTLRLSQGSLPTDKNRTLQVRVVYHKSLTPSAVTSPSGCPQNGTVIQCDLLNITISSQQLKALNSDRRLAIKITDYRVPDPSPNLVKSSALLFLTSLISVYADFGTAFSETTYNDNFQYVATQLYASSDRCIDALVTDVTLAINAGLIDIGVAEQLLITSAGRISVIAQQISGALLTSPIDTVLLGKAGQGLVSLLLDLGKNVNPVVAIAHIGDFLLRIPDKLDHVVSCSVQSIKAIGAGISFFVNLLKTLAPK